MLNETFSVIFKHRVLLPLKLVDLQILILLKRVVSQPAIFALLGGALLQTPSSLMATTYLQRESRLPYDVYGRRSSTPGLL